MATMKNSKKLSILTILFAMSACARGGSGPSVGQFAKPTGTTAKLQKCAETKLTSPQPFVGDDITVCRRNENGKVVRATVTPSFYISGRKKRVHVAQVVGVTLFYDGATPSKDLANKYENAVNEFLTTKCAPKFRTIFHRSGINGRFLFQTFLDADRIVGGLSAIGGSVGDREELFGEGQNRPVFTGDPKKQIGVDRTRISPNVRLELVVGSDEGVMIKDVLNPLSSGPLKKTGNEDQQNRFCAQLLVRVGETMGLGGLAADDKTCVEPTDQPPEPKAEPKDTAKTDVTEPKKSDAVTVPPAAKPSVKKGPIGIMKAGSSAPSELVSTKLAPSEIETMLSPICGTLETLPNAPKTSQK
jgi:hypothetical protein